MKNESIYERNGYKDRADYLRSLSEEWEIPLAAVYALADVLGPNEDFDGLVTEIEDLCCMGW